ncbi:MAG TPA: hypothetical protein VGP72_17875 [Planctomycetota bacterium]|jgi:hypothetical protein
MSKLPDSQAPRQFTRRSALRVVLGTVLAGVVLSVALVALAKQIRAHTAVTPPPALPSRGSSAQQPPEPRLEEAFGAELAKVHQAEEEHLHHYAWVNPKLKEVRIPIDRAMELMLQQEGGTGAPEGKKP